MNGIKTYANGLAVQAIEEDSEVTAYSVYDREGVVQFLIPDIDGIVDDQFIDQSVGGAQRFGFVVEQVNRTFGAQGRGLRDGTLPLDDLSRDEIVSLGMVTESVTKVLTDKFIVAAYQEGMPLPMAIMITMGLSQLMSQGACMLITGGTKSLTAAIKAAKEANELIVPDFSRESWVSGSAKMIRWPGLTASGSNDDCDCPMCRSRRKNTCEDGDN